MAKKCLTEFMVIGLFGRTINGKFLPLAFGRYINLVLGATCMFPHVPVNKQLTCLLRIKEFGIFNSLRSSQHAAIVSS